MSEEKKPGEASQHLTKYSELEANLTTTIENLKVLPAEDNPKRVEIIAENVKGYKLFKREVKNRCEELQQKNVDERKRLLNENKDIEIVAEDLIDRLEEPIKPWIEENKKIADAEEERKRVKREAKLKRINDIKCRLIAIEGFPVISIGNNSNDVSLIIEKLTAIDVEDGSFEEFEDDAVVAKQIALEKLGKMYDDAKKFEDQQAEAKVAQAKLDKERKEFDAEKKEQAKKDAAEQKKRDKKDEDERKERQKKIDKEDAERDKRIKKEDDARAERQKEIDAEDKVRAKEKAEIDAEKKKIADAEQKRVEAENKAKQEKFEKDEAERLVKEKKAKREADTKANDKMRFDCISAIQSQTKKHGLDVDQIIELIEQGKVPHINVEWKVLKEKKETE